MIDTSAPGTAGWWIARLTPKLAAQAAHKAGLNAYYEGVNGIPVTTNKAVRDSYQRLMRLAKLNMAELVVEAVRERMIPLGFRTAAPGDDLGDAEARRIWKANSLNTDSAIVHRAMLAMGDAYVIVGGVDDQIGAPLITAEDPRQVYVEADPKRWRRPIAALKMWRDDTTGMDRVYLYLPGSVVKASKPVVGADEFCIPDKFNGDAWTFDVGTPELLPANIIPVFRFPNQPDSYGISKCEFERHLSILDRINYSTLQRLEIATLQAFRQLAVKGIPDKDELGNDIDYSDVFSKDPGAMWLLPGTAEMWESQQVDLTPIRTAVRDDVQDLAAVTRTPLFYLSPEASQGSAEGASLSREGLIFKATDRITATSDPWEQVMATAFLFAGDIIRSDRSALEVIWSPPERFSLNERANAAAMAIAGGVPWRTVMTDIWQFTPTQVDRMEVERAGDLLLTVQFGDAAPNPLQTPAPSNDFAG